MKIATPDLVTNSYFPALAAEELGLYREEGFDAHVELLPSLDAVNALRDGAVDFVAGGAHTTLLAFPGWKGAKLVVTLSQGTPWLLVLRADLPARRGDVSAVKGLRIAAAPGPDKAFLQILADAGIDPARARARGGGRPGDRPGPADVEERAGPGDRRRTPAVSAGRCRADRGGRLARSAVLRSGGVGSGRQRDERVRAEARITHGTRG